MLRRSLILLVTVGLLVGGLSAATAADAEAVHAIGNHKATQNTFTHRIRVHGWAYDPHHPRQSVGVRIYVDGAYRGRAMADHYSRWVNRHHHIHGKHAYTTHVWVPGRASKVSTRSFGAYRHAHRTVLATHRAWHYYPSAGSRIVSIARYYVGRARYAYGGDSPKSGFDCSGYTKYAYARAHVADLPHSTDAQMALRRMHLVSAHKARRGDLVFYLDGGRPFHVAIYAGHHKQYAAATTKDGVRYQNVWSSNVRYGRYR